MRDAPRSTSAPPRLLSRKPRAGYSPPAASGSYQEVSDGLRGEGALPDPRRRPASREAGLVRARAARRADRRIQHRAGLEHLPPGMQAYPGEGRREETDSGAGPVHGGRGVVDQRTPPADRLVHRRGDPTRRDALRLSLGTPLLRPDRRGGG